MGDPEITQVRDQRPRVGEPEVRSQLEAVGGAQLPVAARAHVTRLRIVIEWGVTLTSSWAA